MLAELQSLGFQAESADLLSRLFTCRGAVPQGSPTSNDALNLFFWRLDHQINSDAGRHGIRYTRVADDFVLSSKTTNGAAEVLDKLEARLAMMGISINQKKKTASGMRGPSDTRLVHGIDVSSPRGLRIRKEHAAVALELADRYLAACKSVSAGSIQSVARKRLELLGWLNHISQADFSPRRTVKQKLLAGDRHVHRRLKKLSISSKGNKWWVISWKRGRNEPRRISNVWQKRSKTRCGSQPVVTCPVAVIGQS